jgi:GTPase
MYIYLHIRLSEGNGQAVYEIGVDDDGTIKGMLLILYYKYQ